MALSPRPVGGEILRARLSVLPCPVRLNSEQPPTQPAGPAMAATQHASHLRWQQHVAKGGRPADDPADWAAPLHDLHRTMSSPSLALPPISEQGCSTPHLPKIGPSSRRGLAGEPPDMSCDWDGRCGTGRSAASQSQPRSVSASRLLQSRGSQASRRSCGSVRSSVTGLSRVTSASLQAEIRETVAQEVAKVVQPLKEKLHSEQSSRQRLEDMLRNAKGEA